MTDRPIIFSASMIRALLDGRKTQTRRLVSPDTCTVNGYRVRRASAEWRDLDFTRAKVRDQSTFMLTVVGPDAAPTDYHLDVPLLPPNDDMRYRVRPIIGPGDRLWVREAWCHTGEGVWTIADARRQTIGHPIYRADHEEAGAAGPRVDAKWWPSIHMPREFSRLTLAVTDVRVQRLQEISEADAITEGMPMPTRLPCGAMDRDPRDDFAELWNALHGDDAWDANPWVVAITFDVIKANIDAMEKAA